MCSVHTRAAGRPARGGTRLGGTRQHPEHLRSASRRRRTRSTRCRCSCSASARRSSSSSAACSSTRSSASARRPDDDGREPPQVYGSKPIEIAWTVGPALIVFVLVLVTARTLWATSQDAAAAGRARSYVTRRRPPVVVGVSAIRELGHRHGQRAARPGQRAGDRRPAYLTPGVGRRRAQLLGAAAGRQDRPDPGPRQPHVVRADASRASTSASAPSTAARSTPTCCCASSSTRRRTSRPWLADAAEAGRATMPGRAGRAGPSSCRPSCVNCHRVRGTRARRATSAPT